MLSVPKPQPLWEAGGRKGLSTGQQVPSSLLHLPQERAGLGSHPRAMAGVGGEPGFQPRPPPSHTHTHTHHGQLLLVSWAGDGRTAPQTGAEAGS